MRAAIYEAGAGKWRIVYDAPPGPDGRRKQKSVTVRGTKKDAQRKRTEILHQLQTGSYVDPARTTVREYLERWLQEYVVPNLAAKTAQEYARMIRKYVIPCVGAVRLTELTPLRLVSFYNKMQREGSLRGNGGLSAQTVVHLHRVLHKALQQAVKWQILIRNPADAAQPPKCQRIEMRVLPDDQVSKLLIAAEGTTLYMPVLLAISTGMRRGEVLALKWQDVDMDAGFLSVRRSLEQTRAGLSFKSPKNSKSKRTVVMPANLARALVKHKGIQAQNKLLLGEGYQDLGMVCCYPDGRPVNPNYLTSAFPGLLQRAGLPHIRFHDLRHTHATMLLAQGVHPKIVSERLGHCTIGITLDTYSHVLPSMQEEAARKIDGILDAAFAEGE